MKVSIVGTAKLVDKVIETPFIVDSKVINFPWTADKMPVNVWESMLAAMASGDPHLLGLPFKNMNLWLYRGKVIQASDIAHLSDEEQKLEVANAVLKHEKRYTQLRRQQEAYARIEHTDAARRERIPDDVRLFVWQRDEGKCVKCGGTERLEFDHIVPVAKGGSNTERNIQLLCEACNRSKGTNI
ncbi:MAG: HNH endonuclease [Planctomycetota bacterium]|nr:HNH endonuclease [Planctomycetota bacterium]